MEGVLNKRYNGLKDQFDMYKKESLSFTEHEDLVNRNQKTLGDKHKKDLSDLTKKLENIHNEKFKIEQKIGS